MEALNFQSPAHSAELGKWMKPQDTKAECYCSAQAFQGHELRALSAFRDFDNSRQTEPASGCFPPVVLICNSVAS